MLGPALTIFDFALRCCACPPSIAVQYPIMVNGGSKIGLNSYKHITYSNNSRIRKDNHNRTVVKYA
jgi:hypothetical protein